MGWSRFTDSVINGSVIFPELYTGCHDTNIVTIAVSDGKIIRFPTAENERRGTDAGNWETN